jgi:hypothetical protein
VSFGRRALLILLLIAPSFARAQEEERLWMPEGYRLLSVEERQALAPGELKAIGARNQELLRAAIETLSSEERQKLVASLESYRNRPQATQVEKQYVTMTTMLLLSAAVEEHTQQMKQAETDRINALIREQEEKSKGFPNELKSVQEEASLVEKERSRRMNSRELYLRILKPLRARPWNQQVRLVFRDLVRGNRYQLLEPALAFVRARKRESPDEGAWPSLEAFLVLTLKDDVGEAKRLFASAVAKGARDVESHVFPLLIAEIEGNEADIARYEPRLRSVLDKDQDLEKLLFEQISTLPRSLQQKARGTFEAKYRGRHPADWEARYRVLMGRFWEKDFEGVEREVASLLDLPMSALPEPHRLKFTSLRLLVKASTGKCAEAVAGIRALEAEAETVYPVAFDSNAPPSPRNEQDVREMRASMVKASEYRAQLETWRTDPRSLPPELASMKPEERGAFLAAASAETAQSVARANELLNGRDDASAARELTRRELEEWEKEHGAEGSSQYDIQTQAEFLTIPVRTQAGICLMDQGDPLAAVQVLRPCAGAGKNLHMSCVGQLIKAATLLAESGRVDPAVKVYEHLSGSYVSLDGLYGAIEKAAPGRVPPPSRSP